MDNWALLKDDLVCLVVSGSHVFEEFLFVGLDKAEELTIFLEDKLSVILEHWLLEVLLTNNLRKGLPTEHLTDDFLLSSDGHLSNCVVV